MSLLARCARRIAVSVARIRIPGKLQEESVTFKANCQLNLLRIVDAREKPSRGVWKVPLGSARRRRRWYPFCGNHSEKSSEEIRGNHSCGERREEVTFMQIAARSFNMESACVKVM